ncbi:MAG: hypothetical protein KGS72_26300 [Cyanobacteria bacterium REEB67]|nr:hypothetical protein [Cyanobacteria bacterium REEB67]
MRQRKSRAKPLYLYHALPFEQVQRGLMEPDRQFSDSEFMPAYEWLGAEVGYFPLFLAIGNNEDDEAVRVTGYQNQWRVFVGGTMEPGQPYVKTYRKAGEFPNFVLFAFELDSVPVRSYNDYQWWNIALTEILSERQVGKGLRRRLFKPTWNESQWLRKASRDGHDVQVVAPRLDLDASAFIWVRNEATQRAMLARGFKNVRVKRISADRPGD